MTVGFVSLTTILPAVIASCTLCVLDRKSRVARGTTVAVGTKDPSVAALDVVGAFGVTPLEIFGVGVLILLNALAVEYDLLRGAERV